MLYGKITSNFQHTFYEVTITNQTSFDWSLIDINSDKTIGLTACLLEDIPTASMFNRTSMYQTLRANLTSKPKSM